MLTYVILYIIVILCCLMLLLSSYMLYYIVIIGDRKSIVIHQYLNFPESYFRNRAVQTFMKSLWLLETLTCSCHEDGLRCGHGVKPPLAHYFRNHWSIHNCISEATGTGNIVILWNFRELICLHKKFISSSRVMLYMAVIIEFQTLIVFPPYNIPAMID